MPRRFWLLLVLCLPSCSSTADPSGPSGPGGGGYYHIGSRIKDLEAPGGFGPSDNFPRPCDDDTPGRKGAISLVACPDEDVIRGKKRLMRLLLVNRTGQAVAFDACDSLLYLVQEERSRGGRWTPIEGFPTTHCGNSYHRVFLGPDEYWEMGAPRFRALVKRKLRFKLLPRNPERCLEEPPAPIYSNEFES
jgi:hypothetical protein